MRNSLKAVFVKPTFCNESFRSKKLRDQTILFDKTRNSLNAMIVKTRVHCTVSFFLADALNLHYVPFLSKQIRES